MITPLFRAAPLGALALLVTAGCAGTRPPAAPRPVSTADSAATRAMANEQARTAGVAMPLVSGAILLAAVSNTNADLIPPTLVAFAAQGLEIIKRLGGWEAAVQLAFDTQQRQRLEYEHATAAPAPR